MERPQLDSAFQYVQRSVECYEKVQVFFLKCNNCNLCKNNCFSSLAAFLKEVSSKSQSFNMLVFHQKSIVESLKTHLSVKDSLAYQPLLE